MAAADVEAMVVELALLGEARDATDGSADATLLHNRARRQSLMCCRIQTKRVERAKRALGNTRLDRAKRRLEGQIRRKLRNRAIGTVQMVREEGLCDLQEFSRPITE